MSQEKTAAIFSALRNLEKVDEALLARSEVGYLPSVLEDSELPEFIASGSFNNGCLVATDRRVIHIEKQVFGSSFTVKSFPYAEILSVKTDFLGIVLTLHTGKTKLVPINRKRNHAAARFASAKVRSGEIFPDISSQDRRATSATNWYVANWLFGMALLIGGVGQLFQGNVIPAFAALGGSALVLPPVREWVYAHTGRSLPVWGRTLALVGLLAVVGESAPSDGTTPEAWTAHDYQIIENKDISVFGRVRRTVLILAPTALTRDDRIATLMEAVIQVHRDEGSPDFIDAALMPFEFESMLGGPLARINYAPDGCGVSGDGCTGDSWTDAQASDAQLTDQQVEIAYAWQLHRERFS